ncbi:hypothetical protein RJT34_03036 [Clitoria ternatea]|uniref:Uncharacterized protein n=1 Tax=Clitoria ternatea TaxID=43366 RepID=A0AAN9KLG4_CLITE
MKRVGRAEQGGGYEVRARGVYLALPKERSQRQHRFVIQKTQKDTSSFVMVKEIKKKFGRVNDRHGISQTLLTVFLPPNALQILI